MCVDCQSWANSSTFFLAKTNKKKRSNERNIKTLNEIKFKVSYIKFILQFIPFIIKCIKMNRIVTKSKRRKNK